MDIKGKVFVVTGGGNGIGREVVLGLLDRGARVAAVDLRADGLAGTVTLAGPNTARLSTHQVNVTDRVAVEALPQAVVEAHGVVDGLLNVAGIIQRFVPFAELDSSDIERVMDVNFWGVVNMVRAFLPLLVQRPTAALVNVSSMGGFLPVPGQTVYGASKAAVKLLTEGLHAELMHGPVRVTVVFPGAIGTNITQNSGVDIPGMGSAEAASHKMLAPSEAGRIIIEGMAKGKYRVLVGSDATLLDRLVRLAPERAKKLIATQMADLLKP
jgi:NAD(P)-dependent dehydrogenase (short-subunit alcohol dehydrogenase family)